MRNLVRMFSGKFIYFKIFVFDTLRIQTIYSKPTASSDSGGFVLLKLKALMCNRERPRKEPPEVVLPWGTFGQREQQKSFRCTK